MTKYLRYFIFLLACSISLLFANANSKEQLFYDAVRLEAIGDFENAIINYEKAALHQSSANLHGNLANLYYKTNDYGRSILNFKKAILLDKKNRDFQYNLEFVCKTAQVDSSSQQKTDYFTLNSSNFWKGILAIFFWSGMLVITFLFFRGFHKKPFFLMFTGWIAGNIALSIFLHFSIKSEDLSEREIIAIESFNNSDQNSTNIINLRRFAASSSSANSSVKAGEILLLEKSQKGEISGHISENNQEWLLVSTPDRRKKGWVLKEEVGWIIAN